MTPKGDEVIRWLLDGDPAIRWQVLRDLVGAPDATVEAERRRVAREGWGGRLLARQDCAGTWGGGLYNPKWTSTTYTMLLLRDLGLPPSTEPAQRACTLLLDHGLRPDGGVNFGRPEGSETCISGMVLSIGSHFEHDDERLDTIADHLLGRQMNDGGWNCRYPGGATHASVHTTIIALEGLLLYGRYRRRRRRTVLAALRRGREFLLVHRLFRSHRSGNVIKPEFKRFSFPPRGTTTSSERSIISGLPELLVIGEPPRRSMSFAGANAPMAGGRSRTATGEGPTSKWRPWGPRAAGTHSGRSGFFSGGKLRTPSDDGSLAPGRGPCDC